MWTFPWSKRENVQHFYFPRSECGIVFLTEKTWRSYFLTVWAWEILRSFSFPPKPSSNLPTNLPMTAAGPILSGLYKGCPKPSWSVSQRPWYLEHAILCHTLTKLYADPWCPLYWLLKGLAGQYVKDHSTWNMPFCTILLLTAYYSVKDYSTWNMPFCTIL